MNKEILGTKSELKTKNNSFLAPVISFLVGFILIFLSIELIEMDEAIKLLLLVFGILFSIIFLTSIIMFFINKIVKKARLKRL